MIASRLEEIPTPAVVIDAAVVRRNLAAMAAYARTHGLNLRPHTKTHKSIMLARLQMAEGAVGLTVAKAGEAEVMGQVSTDLVMAYPAVDPGRCAVIADLARTHTVRVAVDSVMAAEMVAVAARSAGSTVGVLADLDVGHHRTGVQSPAEALQLATAIDGQAGLRLEGLLFFPGQIGGPPAAQEPALRRIGALLGEVIGLWRKSGLEARLVSGGSTPTALQSHFVEHLTEIRPGTYIFNDMNCVHGQCATLEDCAARIVSTVMSSAVPGQVVLDAGTKTLTSDRCGPAPESGHGHIVEYPDARIARLNEEHGQVDVSRCRKPPRVGERVTIIPNHICPCVNLQDRVWWREGGEELIQLPVDARGKVT